MDYNKICITLLILWVKRCILNEWIFSLSGIFKVKAKIPINIMKNEKVKPHVHKGKDPKL